MIDTLTDIEPQDYDEYNRRNFRRRRKKRRRIQRRRPPVKYGNLGFPIKVRFPTKKHPKIVKGTPNKAIKLPPVKPASIKNTGVIKPKISTSIPNPKPIGIKRGGKFVKQKVSIDELVPKTNSNPKKSKVISAKSKAIKHKTSSIDNSKKTSAKSDSRVGKIAKVVAGIGLIGVSGYGIYRYIQYRKKKGANLKK